LSIECLVLVGLLCDIANKAHEGERQWDIMCKEGIC